MLKFKYRSLNIPSGQSFLSEIECLSENDFLRHLNDWNRRGNGNWLYFSVAYIAPKLLAENVTSLCESDLADEG